MFYRTVSGHLTHDLVVCARIVFIYIVGGGAGKHEALEVVFQYYLRSLYPRSGCVCPHSFLFLLEGWAAKNGALKVVFQNCLRLLNPRSGCECPHSVCLF